MSLLVRRKRYFKLCFLSCFTKSNQKLRLLLFSPAEGTSDDLDEVMMAVTADTAFAEEHGLLIFNSINVGRILGQIPMYFYAYYRLCNIDTMDPLEVVIPTGGCGSITGYLFFQLIF